MGHLVLQGLPDESAQILARRIIETGDLVQHVVIELPEQRQPGVVDDRKVDDPSRLGIHRATQRDLDAIAMAMDA